jgi:hypothetical protein
MTYQYVFPQISKMAYLGNVTLPDLWGVNPALLIGVFIMATLFLFYFLERGLKRKDKLEEEK